MQNVREVLEEGRKLGGHLRADFFGAKCCTNALALLGGQK